MSNWIKTRRRNVGDLAQKAEEENPDLLNLPETGSLPGWTEGHQHELDFQRSKQRSNLIEAYRDNCLLPGDVDEQWIKQLADEASVKEKEKDKLLIRARKTMENVDRRNNFSLDWNDYSGCKVWVPRDDSALAAWSKLN